MGGVVCVGAVSMGWVLTLFDLINQRQTPTCSIVLKWISSPKSNARPQPATIDRRPALSAATFPRASSSASAGVAYGGKGARSAKRVKRLAMPRQSRRSASL